MSEVKVNKISPRSGTEVTLGDSGDTFTIPSGATINNQGTATNFGATGSASWTTTVKTGDFTAVAGEGYFVNTTSGAVNVTLPAGTAGAVVAIKDYAGTFDTNAVTLVQNGSDKIGGSTVNATLDAEGIAVTLVFIDSTQGWLVTDSGLQDEASTASFVTATGGTITTVCTNFKVHTFTGPGTFCVSAAGNAAGSNTVSYMVIGGGGGAGSNAGGAGGAGGYREGKTTTCSYTASPLNAPAGLPVSVQGYSIVVGGGGAGSSSGTAKGTSGVNSSFSSITSAGGGGGGSSSSPYQPGVAGGSGGGGRANASASGGAGNTPPVSPPQGNPGGATGPGSGPIFVGGGGGGAGGTGCSGGPGPGAGGAGATTSINGTPTVRASGGSGGSNGCSNSGGGTTPGGGGTGANNPATGTAGTANTGGGGGSSGGSASPNGGLAGGSGIVIIRYKFQ